MVRKLILYISMSLDGYLADANDSLDFLSSIAKEGEDYGYKAFTAEVDTYIVGRKTYEVVLGLCNGVFPQAKDYDCYVISRQSKAPENGVTFYNGEIKALINKLKSKEGKHIYCDGGGQIVSMLLAEELIDEMIISVVPYMLGSGKRLFPGNYPEGKLKLLELKNYATGLVQLHYQCNIT